MRRRDWLGRATVVLAVCAATAGERAARADEPPRPEIDIEIDETLLDWVPFGRTSDALLGVATGARRDRFGTAHGGASAPESRVFIDGLDVSDPLRGLGAGRLHIELVDGATLVWGGWGAGRGGGATGALLELTLPRGGDRMHGAVFAAWTPWSGEAERVSLAPASLSAKTTLEGALDLGLALSGPLLPGHVHFQLSFAPAYATNRVTRIIGTQVDRDADGAPDRGADQLPVIEEVDRSALRAPARTLFFTAGVDVVVDADHQGSLRLAGEDGRTRLLGVAGAPQSTQVDRESLVLDGVARWSSRFPGSRIVLDLLAGWHHQSFDESPAFVGVGDEPHVRVSATDLGSVGRNPQQPESEAVLRACTDDDPLVPDAFPEIVNCPVSGYSFGGPGFLDHGRAERRVARAAARWRPDAAGAHELELGAEGSQVVAADRGLYTGGRLAQGGFGAWSILQPVTLSDQGAFVCDESVGLRCDPIDGHPIDVSGVGLALFARERWRPVAGLLLDAGVRVDGQLLQAAETLSLWAVSPRLGASWDPLGDGRGRVYAHAGRSMQAVPLHVMRGAFSPVAHMIWDFDWNLDCGGPPTGADDAHTPRLPSLPSGCPVFPQGVPQLFSPLQRGEAMPVAADLAPPMQEELILGGEWQLDAGTRAGMAYQARRLVRVIEDVGTPTGGLLLANPGEGEAAHVDRPRRRYDAVHLTVRHSRGGLTLLASYSYSRLQGNTAGLTNDDTFQLSPNLLSDFDSPELLANRDGRLPGDRPHNLKLDAVQRFPLGGAGDVLLGARVRALSGAPIDTLGRHPLYGSNEVFILPRGSGGRTAPQFGADLRAGWERPLAGGMRLALFVDLLNLFDLQMEARVDERYTFDAVAPIVGGDAGDLLHLKRLGGGGGATEALARKNPLYAQPVVRLAPISLRFGFRLQF